MDPGSESRRTSGLVFSSATRSVSGGRTLLGVFYVGTPLRSADTVTGRKRSWVAFGEKRKTACPPDMATTGSGEEVKQCDNV